MLALARILHYASILLTLVILASWGMFASEEITKASSDQSAQVADSADDEPAEPAVDDRGDVRKAIDETADSLTSPFDGIVSDDAGEWAKRTVPTVFGLLLWGLGLAVLSRWLLTRA